MTQAMRSALKIPNNKIDHAGLALAKYLEETDDTHEKAKELLQNVMESSANEAYKKAFARWKGALSGVGANSFVLSLAGPLAVGLGNESPLEVGFTTHFTYGMPIIPGSALKGLCRRGASNLEKNGGISKAQLEALFGSQELASQFIFWDAWYDPDTVEGKPFHRDVVTVHHPEYYQKKGKEAWPTDFDDPNPIPFLCVRPKAGFLFAISAPDEKWGKFAQELLKWSLENLGVGAKTNAGYGFFMESKSAGDGPNVTVTENIVWANSILNRNPGTGEISAILTGTSIKANAIGAAANDLYNKLSPEVKEIFKKNKWKLKADVEVKRQGNNNIIVKITPKA